MDDLKRLHVRALSEPTNLPLWQTMFDLCRALWDDQPDNQEGIKLVMAEIWSRSNINARTFSSPEWYQLYQKATLFRGTYNFDCYMLACEARREPAARFWMPRRAILEGKHRIASQIQDFLDDPEALFLGFSMPPGTGKALADDTPILTKTGWKKHGDLVVGDLVIAPTGEFVKVTHVHPKVEVDREVVFTNGERIYCNEKHEWQVFDRTRGSLRLYDTASMELRALETGPPKGNRGHRYLLQVPLIRPVQGEYRDLPVAPYTFGVWLGDGRNNNPDICGDKKDRAVVDRVISEGYGISWETTHKTTGVQYYGFRNLRAPLQSMGFCHSRRRVEKHIPDIYLTASLEQRLQLLAGLLDTDGTCIKKEGKYIFTTSEIKLRDTFIQLVSTFGWRVNVIEVPPGTSTSGITSKKPHWRIQFITDMVVPCVLDRKKQEKLRKQRRFAIAEINKVAPRRGNCISVEGGMYLAGYRLVPTHNSTMLKFLLAFIAGSRPISANMYVSYSDGMVKMMLDSIKDITTNTEEYAHNDIFPTLGAPDISAEYATVSYRRRGDFPTIGMVSIGGSVTGRTRANGLLVTDDLVRNAEMARSPDRLEKLNADYLATLTTRMIGDNVKQIMLGTIWSVHDPISRMKEAHQDDPRYRFINIPVEDEEGNSNFEFEHPDRYTRTSITNIRNTLEPEDFSALYMGRPLEKAGLVFARDRLLYYDGVLPDGEPDNIFFHTDVAWGGGDNLSMPICYEFDDAWYIDDVLYDPGHKDITKPLVVGKILRHKARIGHFEADNGGHEYCDDISRILRQEHGYSCSLSHTKAPSTKSKLSRIEQHAPEIRRIYFRSESCRDKEYERFMRDLQKFSLTAKNKNDDAPDSLAGLVDKFRNNRPAKVKSVRRTF